MRLLHAKPAEAQPTGLRSPVTYILDRYAFGCVIFLATGRETRKCRADIMDRKPLRT